MPITNLQFAKVSFCSELLKTWHGQHPRWEQAQKLLPDSSSHFPTHIPLLTDKFPSLGSCQEGKNRKNIFSILYQFGSWLCVLGKRVPSSLIRFNSVYFPGVGQCPSTIFFVTALAPSLLFNYCCTPLLRALHDDFHVCLLRETLKNLSPSAYQKFSLF